ncbi:DinB family protein [Deinococcus navajonensis]|uniref:DinB family protein n=1 Tax=Deinococcus navajonensis TaxID=309884 RepID=A0ABV8XPV4_9DEIO
MKVQTFLADAFEQELSMLRSVLESVPEEDFAAPRLGHSPAWHALHMAEWLRLFALQDFGATYAHLGWEDAPWTATLRGTPAVTEQAGKAAVLAELERVGAQVVTHTRHLSDEQLNDMLRAPAAPSGERQRLTGLGMQLRHAAYHRGQLKLSLKDSA